MWLQGQAYILVKGNIWVNNTAAADAAVSNTNKKYVFKNCAPFNDCISKMSNTQVDNAKDIDVVMPMYNLIEYRDSNSKTSGRLWQYFLDILAVNNNGNIADFNGANSTDSFNFKIKITGQINDNGIIINEIMIPLKYFSSFWRTLEMSPTNCEVNLIFDLVCRLCYNLHWYCKSHFYIHNNWNTSLCSSSYFINSR